MENLISQGEYFSGTTFILLTKLISKDEVMQLRQPALYQRYVGKYEKGVKRKFKDDAKLSERLLINNDICDAQEEAEFVFFENII